MNKRRTKMVIATLLVSLVPNPGLAYSRSESGNDQAGSRLEKFLTPDEEFIMAFNSAKALPYLASARKDIGRKNISGAQSEVGQALTLIDEMKSRFPVIRLEGADCGGENTIRLRRAETGIGIFGIDYACAGEYPGACGFEGSNRSAGAGEEFFEKQR